MPIEVDRRPPKGEVALHGRVGEGHCMPNVIDTGSTHVAVSLAAAADSAAHTVPTVVRALQGAADALVEGLNWSSRFRSMSSQLGTLANRSICTSQSLRGKRCTASPLACLMRLTVMASKSPAVDVKSAIDR